MADESAKLEQNKHDKPVSFHSMAVMTGLIGGILWGTVGYLSYIFNFTEIHPNVVLEPWTIGEWKKGWLGTLISILFIGGFSIIAALIYYIALRKLKNIFVGICYGIVLFLLVFIVLNPIFPEMEPITELNKNTIITSICIYILFGTFVGYSISYEQEEIENNKRREKDMQTN